MPDTEEERPKEATLWPDTSNLAGAIAASNQGLWAAAALAVIKFALPIYSVFSVADFSMNAWFLVDAILFGAIAFGIWKKARSAAVGGMILYLAEQYWIYQNNGETNVIVTLLLFYMFANGIRGTFAYGLRK